MAQGITNSILVMLIIMLSINIGLTMVQSSVDDLGVDLSVLNASKSPLTNYHTGDLDSGTSLIDKDYIPSDVSADADESTNSFTDVFVAMRSWVSAGLDSLGFLANLLLQPAGFMRDVGFNSAVCLSVQILWSMTFIFLLTAWIMGRT